MMENRAIELIIVSATDLKKVKAFRKQSSYAVAYIYPNQKKVSNVDNVGGVNPSWNSKLTLHCDDSLLQRTNAYITVEIFSRGSLSDKLVGTSKIQIQDVVKEANGAPKPMAFQVRRPSGKVKGVLNVSVKLSELDTVGRSQSSPSQGYSEQGSSTPTAIYPPWNYGRKVDNTTPYPPPRANAQSVYPPQAPTSPATYSSGGRTSSVYPPQSSSRMEEPVLAYPVTGYSLYGQHYPPQYNQQYYPSPQASAPYNYQQSYYSRPSKRTGGSGIGMGLLGGALGGLLLGDIIGDMSGC